MPQGGFQEKRFSPSGAVGNASAFDEQRQVKPPVVGFRPAEPVAGMDELVGSGFLENEAGPAPLHLSW